MKSRPLLRWLNSVGAMPRLLASVALAGLVFLLLSHRVPLSTQLLLTWDTGTLCFLVLVLAVILPSTPKQIRQRAQREDVGVWVISTLVVGAAVISLVAIGFLLGSMQKLPDAQLGLHIALSGLAVVCSWLLMHTVFTLRYAHGYYGDASPTQRDRHAGGLEFPGEPSPDYWDFAYFAFVIAMTAQVSDVQITSRFLRRLALVHSILSFGFNTPIVALSVNVLSQLLGSRGS